MVKVFYHNDCDGWCSAFWVRKYLENEKINFAVDDFIEMNYDKKFPWDSLTTGERVFMVDFSLDAVDMIKLDDMCDLTWIDHHKTAIDKISDLGSKNVIKGVRCDGIAACALTWLYLISGIEIYCNIRSMSDEINRSINTYVPLFTQYIHLWDTWQWKNHPEKSNIEAFIIGLQAIDTHPVTGKWDIFDRDYSIQDIIDSGKSMIYFRDGYAEGLCDSIGKVIEFEGYKCFVCNMPHCNSEWFITDPSLTYDIMMPFYYSMQTEQFCFSLYTTKDIDVSKIAVKYGGGGHSKAAGFQSKTLPFI